MCATVRLRFAYAWSTKKTPRNQSVCFYYSDMCERKQMQIVFIFFFFNFAFIFQSSNHQTLIIIWVWVAGSSKTMMTDFESKLWLCRPKWKSAKGLATTYTDGAFNRVCTLYGTCTIYEYMQIRSSGNLVIVRLQTDGRFAHSSPATAWHIQVDFSLVLLSHRTLGEWDANLSSQFKLWPDKMRQQQPPSICIIIVHSSESAA